MFSVSTKSGTTRPRESWQPEWNWTESQYRELIQLYMNFVDQEEITKGTPPTKPHRNRVLIQRAFDLFSRVAPRDCILRALKVCNILEEEPYKLAMDPMAEPSDINIRHHAQWDINYTPRQVNIAYIYVSHESKTFFSKRSPHFSTKAKGVD